MSLIVVIAIYDNHIQPENYEKNMYVPGPGFF